MIAAERKSALGRGDARYFTGKPCKNGHIAERRTVNGWCLPCSNERTRKWKRDNPEHGRAAQRKRDGLPLPTYPPPGYCEICGTTDPGKKSWHLDHDHATDKFRGWLCGWCNRGLGHLRDNPVTMDKAAHYLRSRAHKQETL